jgi:hypothetical protein
MPDSREQYGNIEEAKTSQMIPNGPKPRFLQVFVGHELPLILNHLALSISSPEKAGGGGSIPSLATIFSTTYSHTKTQVCSILFQKLFAGSSEFASLRNGASGSRPTWNLDGIRPQPPEVADGCLVLPRLE